VDYTLEPQSPSTPRFNEPQTPTTPLQLLEPGNSGSQLLPSPGRRGISTPSSRRSATTPFRRRLSGSQLDSETELTAADQVNKARRKLYGTSKMSKTTQDDINSGSKSIVTDEFYGSCVTLRSLPVSVFLSDKPPKWPLPITSINEDRLLKQLGVSKAERAQIEGLQMGNRSASSATNGGLTEEQLSSKAIVKLAASAPPDVGTMQRRTASWLCRPFPLGLRFSGKNMSPLPGWLAGAHHIALNMSNVDLPVQLHFAMFKGSDGYVLKPPEMCVAPNEGKLLMRSKREKDDDTYWPPARETLHCTDVAILSLHNLPKRGEQRPRYNGEREDCHKYHPELSGPSVMPDNQNPSCPAISISLHPVGGFCAVSDVLPLAPNAEVEISVPPEQNGMRASFGDTVHCVAAEPYATFLRIGITDGGQEVAYEIAVLGRLRCGYRVLQLRNLYGTRIELCYLLVRIELETEPNLWVSPRQVRMQTMERRRKADVLHDENARLKQELAQLKSFVGDGRRVEMLGGATPTKLGQSIAGGESAGGESSCISAEDEDDSSSDRFAHTAERVARARMVTCPEDTSPTNAPACALSTEGSAAPHCDEVGRGDQKPSAVERLSSGVVLQV